MSRRSGRVCPVESAGMLDGKIRAWLQNPEKILRPYLEEGMTALDLGCGPGFFSVPMARIVGSSGRVIAADLQDGMLRKVEDKIKGTELEERITLHKCEEGGTGLSERIDFALLFYLLHEVPDQERTLRDIEKILKPDGQVLVVEPPFHVSRKAFRETVGKAGAAGLAVIDRPGLFLNHTALFGRSAATGSEPGSC